MKLSVLSLFAIGGLLLAVLVAARQSSAQESIDISGNWNLQVTGLYSFEQECAAAIAQQDAAVSVELDCPSSGELSLNGTIDPLTGDFTTTGQFYGVDIVFFGVASNDSMHGNISSIDGWGSFHGTRILATPTPTPIPPFILDGDFGLTMDVYKIAPPGAGGPPVNCVAFLEQTVGDISGAVSCLGNTARVSGTADLQEETFHLDWTFSFGAFALDGARNPATGALTGTYTVSTLTGNDTFGIARTDQNLWGTARCFGARPGFDRPSQNRPVVNANVAALDALFLQTHLPFAQSLCLLVLDVNADGQIDARDAMLILQHEAGLIPRLPVL